MRMEIHDLGQIKNGSIEFGDLTVLVGQQASGKTLFLEMLKLLIDTGYIHHELGKHGLDWGGRAEAFLNLFLGEGMGSVLRESSSITQDGKSQSISELAVRRNRSRKNRLFYVPAQRVLTINNGWPMPFQSYMVQDPYVVREFSETFRRLMDKELSTGGALFPQTNRLKKAYRTLLTEHVFHGFELRIDTHGAQRRLVLAKPKESIEIPFMAWSAGQREFVPLLLGLYWLLPASKVSRRDDIEWVVLEELEAGLHPAAISSVLMIILELLSRGYRVSLSTHSPHVLDMIWAIQNLRENNASPDQLLDIFKAPRNPQTRTVAQVALQKEYRVYFFDALDGVTKDITSLNPSSDDPRISEWGGLTEFSGRAADIIADVVAETPYP